MSSYILFNCSPVTRPHTVHWLFDLDSNQGDDPKNYRKWNKLDTKANISFLSSPMLQKSHGGKFFFPFPLPYPWVGGGPLDHTCQGTSIGIAGPEVKADWISNTMKPPY